MRMEAHPGFSPKPLPETRGVKVRNWREGKDLADISLAEAMKGCGYVGRGRRGWWRRAGQWQRVHDGSYHWSTQVFNLHCSTGTERVGTPALQKNGHC